MPELPEVETIRRGLERLLPDRTIVAVEVMTARSFPGWSTSTADNVLGAAVTGCERRGKVLMLHLDNDFTLMTHLRMTGQLIFRSAITGLQSGSAKKPSPEQGPGSSTAKDGGNHLSAKNSSNRPTINNGDNRPATEAALDKLPNRFTRVIISFGDGSHLSFNDQRKFGYLKLTPTALLCEDAFLRRMVPEPLDSNFTWHRLRSRLPLRSTQAIKAVLLDQSVIAGIGNIYADESLFLARIHPETSVSSLDTQAIKRLHSSIRGCLQQAINDGGSTARDYVDAEGLRGEYLSKHACVYGRNGLPCPVCGRPITKMRVAGRGTHYCSHCQK